MMSFASSKFSRAHLAVIAIIFASLGGYFTYSSFAAATTYYVSTTGSDSNTGSSSAPWRTIQKAANTVAAGDTVIVQAGTYAERASVSRSGASGAITTYQATGTVNMKGFNISANYVRVAGFTIANTTGSSITDRAGGSGVYVSGSHDEVNQNTISNTSAAGIYLNSSGGSNTVNGNTVSYAIECGIWVNGTNNLVVSNDISHTRSVNASDADGLRFLGTGSTVRKNYIHDILLSDSPGQSPHIDDFQTWGPASNYVFEQNRLVKDSSQTQSFTIEGDFGAVVSNIVIRNNIFTSKGNGYNSDVNMGPDTAAGSAVTGVSVVNNTFVVPGSAAEFAIWLITGTQNAVIRNNVFYNHGNSGESYVRTDSGTTGTAIDHNAIFESNNTQPSGGIRSGDFWYGSTTPGFVSLAGADYHLTSGSILINKGTTISGVANDYDGITRPQGVAFDIGAFEQTSSTPTPTPPPAPASGDVNGDGRINALDLSALISHDGQNYPAADLNKDGTVGAADMAILLSKWTW